MRRAAAIVLTAALTFGASCTFAENVAPREDLTQTIRYLLDFVANSDCLFIRNGWAHTGKEAAAHMSAKYDYYKNEIKTAEDFIRLAGSKSVLSGQPYLVKTADDKQMKSADWLGQALRDYRASRSAASK